MLLAENLHVAGRHHDLVPGISLHAATGELLLITADTQPQRTSVALTLSGRMRPDGGRISWDQHTEPSRRRQSRLRQNSALVDSPGINEPEQHLNVRDLVTEDLALIPRRHRSVRSARDWLTVNSFADIAEAWVDDVPPTRRLTLLCALALADPMIRLLVVDSPDRHSTDPAFWLDQLRQLARNPRRPLCIVATIAYVPKSWEGPVVRIPHPVEVPSEQPDGRNGDAKSLPTSGQEKTR